MWPHFSRFSGFGLLFSVIAAICLFRASFYSERFLDFNGFRSVILFSVLGLQLLVCLLIEDTDMPEFLLVADRALLAEFLLLVFLLVLTLSFRLTKLISKLRLSFRLVSAFFKDVLPLVFVCR